MTAAWNYNKDELPTDNQQFVGLWRHTSVGRVVRIITRSAHPRDGFTYIDSKHAYVTDPDAFLVLPADNPPRVVVKLKCSGIARVLSGHEGQTFIVDKFTPTIDNRGLLVHVRDYRYPNDHRKFQTWTLGPDDYEVIK